METSHLSVLIVTFGSLAALKLFRDFANKLADEAVSKRTKK